MKWSDLLQWEGSSLSQQAQVYDKNVESLKSASESLDANLSSLTGQGNTVNAARRALLKLRVEIEEQAVKMEAIASILSEKPSVRLPGSSTAPPRTTPSISGRMDPFSTWDRTTCLQQMR